MKRYLLALCVLAVALGADAADDAIAVQWPLPSLSQFLIDHAADDVQRANGQVGLGIPSVLVINGYGALVAVSSPELLSVQDLRRTPAGKGEALAAMLSQVVDGEALAGQLDRRRPTIVLLTIDAEQCVACAAAPHQVQRVIAREGRPWNRVHATASAEPHAAAADTAMQ
ncbi:MAG: hypothetical protein M0Q42_10750 [Xanthomonadales bacterium]|nr:hypothetical protein [Xanthomonadales bacterium]